MVRRVKASRAVGPAVLPTPVPSNQATPLSSAYPSTYASDTEWAGDVESIPIGSLSLNASEPKQTEKPFPLLSLPIELRLKVYDFHFANAITAGRVVDLDPDNHKTMRKLFALFKTCRTVYNEASHHYYSTRTFRIFPTHPGRFFKTKKPLLARLKAAKRSQLTSLELRLGPGWSKPPPGWVVNPALGLKDCVNVRRLTVFVECDPGDNVFNGFRRADGFYESFSRDLLKDVLAGLPGVKAVHFDAWSSVKKSGAMMQGLFDVVLSHDREVRWGPERGWTGGIDGEEVQQGHSNSSNVVQIPSPVLTLQPWQGQLVAV
ncbi:hypothetical protein SODALDRAFT_323027 [Sodiomyces alkalinus F11]|uniref:Uncharacterized protein n=1 Tax=Sodiomyces alkalinus (strain CBS 110278 / VKM F-3762 / F11) TaxID=1314773 RepID=A0A3N2PYU5_SODAK|nr:hypothetical protein SODALDRAFT_323027 [Sodiomyces alkalinus F11]ROT39662.1 hypothetical protein SODALDRAFT_323027 [Sodiomyces alkalinus F11]